MHIGAVYFAGKNGARSYLPGNGSGGGGGNVTHRDKGTAPRKKADDDTGAPYTTGLTEVTWFPIADR